MEADPFDVLGIPPTFDIDLSAVQRAWLKLSAALHPDRAPDAEQAAAELARVNLARQTILDPESRANALLARLGGSTKETDRSLPDGFLPEMLEVRESAEDARQSGDAAGWASFKAWADERRALHIKTVSELFAALGATPSPEALKAIRVELNAWRYVERMIEQLDDSRAVR